MGDLATTWENGNATIPKESISQNPSTRPIPGKPDHTEPNSTKVDILDATDDATTVENEQSTAPVSDNEETVDRRSKRDQFTLIIFIFTFNVIASVSYNVFPVLYVEFTEYFDVSKGAGAWVGSAYVPVSIVISLAAGLAIKQKGCRVVSTIGGIVTVIGFLSSCFAPNIWVLYFTYGLTGVGRDLMTLSSAVFVQQRFKRNRTLATGICLCGNSMGLIIGPLSASLLVTHYGWRGCMLLLAGLVMNNVAIGMLFRSPQHLLNKKPIGNPKKVLRETFNFSLFQQRYFVIYLTGVTVYVLNMASFVNHYVSRAVSIGIDKEAAALLMTYMGLMLTISRFLGSVLMNFAKNMNRVTALAIGYVVSGLVTGVGVWLFASQYAGCVVILLAMAAVHSQTPALTDMSLVQLLGLEDLPQAMVLTKLAANVGRMLGVPFTGWVFDVTQNYDLPYVLLGTLQSAVGLLCIWNGIVFGKHMKKRDKQLKEAKESQLEPLGDPVVMRNLKLRQDAESYFGSTDNIQI